MKFSNKVLALKFIGQLADNTAERAENHSGSFWFVGNHIYSYGTQIGMLKRDCKGELHLLLSYENFSNTTNKHINALLIACCKYSVRYIYVPFRYGNTNNTVESLGRTFKEDLQYKRQQYMGLKKHREDYQWFVFNAERFDEAFYTLEDLSNHLEYAQWLRDPLFVKEIQRQHRSK